VDRHCLNHALWIDFDRSAGARSLFRTNGASNVDLLEGGGASIKSHPVEESKNEKRQKSADYCVK
jgi:hypothetical protein